MAAVAANSSAPHWKSCGPAGLTLDVVETHAPGEATQLTRDGYARGYRAFLGVGGDGTSYEIVNGLFPEALDRRASDAWISASGHGQFFPARFFRSNGVDYAMESLLARRSRKCDVFRMTHKDGVIYYINLLQRGVCGRRRDRARAEVQPLRTTRLFHRHLLRTGTAQPETVPADGRRANGARSTPMSLPHFQQQQVHRWNHDDCAAGPHRRWVDRVRSLGADLASWANQESKHAL